MPPGDPPRWREDELVDKLAKIQGSMPGARYVPEGYARKLMCSLAHRMLHPLIPSDVTLTSSKFRHLGTISTRSTVVLSDEGKLAGSNGPFPARTSVN